VANCWEAGAPPESRADRRDGLRTAIRIDCAVRSQSVFQTTVCTECVDLVRQAGGVVKTSVVGPPKSKQAIRNRQRKPAELADQASRTSKLGGSVR
jgi:hypothetical protein